MADEIKLKAPTVEQQVNVVINGEEKLKSFASTLENIASNKNLQKYWKDQKQLIDDVIDAYSNFTKNTSKNNALELMKTTNALKALSDVDISSLIPDFKNFSQALENAKKVAGGLDSAFSVNSFKDAFSSFETLRAYGIDLENFFKHFELDINVANLQESLRLAQQETRRVRRELSETQEELSSKKIELASFIDGSGLTEQIEKLRYLEDEIKYVREQASEEFRTFLKGNDFSGWDLDENGAFERYFNEIRDGSLTAKEAIANFKSEYSYLLQEKFNESGGLFNLQQIQAFENKLETVLSRVEEISRQMNDIVENGVITKAMQNLSVDDTISQSQRDLFANVLKDEEALSSIAGVLKKIIDESVALQGVNNKTFDEEQFSRLLILFEKIESSLSSMKAVFVDVGDGEEFSPLLKMINNVQESIEKLSTSVKGIGLNMNIDVGSDKELETQFQDKISKALIAYQRLFDHIKMSGVGGSVINDAFFNFDLNQFDTTIGKVKGLQQFIAKAREDAKALYGGQDVLKQDTDVKFWNQASAALAQMSIVEKQIKDSADTSSLESLFGGKTDLTEVTTQLGLIVTKLEEISANALEFKNIFKEGFNVTASIEEIEKLTSRVKELEDELSKVKVSSTSPVETNISSPIKDTFQGDKIEQATTSAKELDKTLEQAVDVPTDDFDEILSKLDLTKSKLGEIVKITKQGYAGEDGKFIESFVLKDKNGSSETYGASSNTEKGQLLRYNYIEKNTEAINKQKNAEKEHQAQKDAFHKKNLNAIDMEIKKREEESSTYAKTLKSQMEERYSAISSMEKSLDNYNSKLEKFSVKPDDGHRYPVYQQQIDNLTKKISELDTLKNNLSKKDIIDESDMKSVNALQQEIDKLILKMNNMSAGEKGFDPLGADKALEKINSELKKNSAMSKEAKRQIQGFYDEIRSGNPSKPIKDLLDDMYKLIQAERLAGREGKSFMDIFKEKVVYGAAANMAGMIGIYDIINVGRQGFETIKEYDKALTEMNKVSNESIEILKEFQQESFEVADSIGATASAIQNSTADWMKLGYSLKDSAELSEWANIYANVGDMEIDEATEHMVSSVKAWSSEFANDIEASEAIVDRYNHIGNSYAITSADIGEAMETSAAALKAGGNSLNESLGLIVSGNLIQQDASTTASALKILSLRVRGAKADLEEMGETTEGLADSSSKMREEIQALTGVDIMLDEDTFKSTAQIIKEIGAVWDSMSDVSQAATLEKIAGKNRASTVAGLIENYELIDDVIKSAEEAQGSALKENQRYVESIEGSLNRLSSTWDKLWVNENNREVITFFIDLGRGILEVVDDVGVLNTAIMGIGAFAGIKNVGIGMLVAY